MDKKTKGILEIDGPNHKLNQITIHEGASKFELLRNSISKKSETQTIAKIKSITCTQCSHLICNSQTKGHKEIEVDQGDFQLLASPLSNIQDFNRLDEINISKVPRIQKNPLWGRHPLTWTGIWSGEDAAIPPNCLAFVENAIQTRLFLQIHFIQLSIQAKHLNYFPSRIMNSGFPPPLTRSREKIHEDRRWPPRWF